MEVVSIGIFSDGEHRDGEVGGARPHLPGLLAVPAIEKEATEADTKIEMEKTNDANH